MIETIRTIYNEHVSYKDQIIRLAKSDLIKTYRGAALGWAWAIVKPLITLLYGCHNTCSQSRTLANQATGDPQKTV